MKDNLNPKKFGLAGGILAAIYIAITTIISMYGYCDICSNFLVGIYGNFGFTLSWFGAILGAIYAFIDAFIALWIFAWIYNRL